MKETQYFISNPRFGRELRFALVSDLHAQDPAPVLAKLDAGAPDYILLAGDILERLDGTEDEHNVLAFPIFAACAQIAPTFYCFGNHEDGATHTVLTKKSRIGCGMRHVTEKNRQKILQSGVTLLENSYHVQDGIAFGGLCSGLIQKDKKPTLDWLFDFCLEDLPRVLLCHHPEYYVPYLKQLPLDLIVSGHAHGGQWRLFGRGVFAPGQGLFPKYANGLYDNRFVISTGLKKGAPMPRFFNPPELCWIHITK